MVLCGLAVYAVAIEPGWLHLSEHKVPAPRLIEPLKVVLVADLHADTFGRFEARVARTVVEQEPDLILVAGDLVTPTGTTEGATAFLESLSAPLGVFWVPGNHEHWALPGEPRSFFDVAGAQPLVNEAVRIRDDVWLVGLDDRMAGRPKPEVIDTLPTGVLRLAMFHSPMGIRDIAGRVDFAFRWTLPRRAAPTAIYRPTRGAAGNRSLRRRLV